MLGGIIYLHDISQSRFNGTSQRNIRLFEHLCGDDKLDSVALVATKADRIGTFGDPATQFDNLKKYWASIMTRGAQAFLLDGSSTMEPDILGSVLKVVGKKIAQVSTSWSGMCELTTRSLCVTETELPPKFSASRLFLRSYHAAG